MHHFKNASSQLDPLPTCLLKGCADVLTPIITMLINLSLQEGRFPARWKVALVILLLKKLGLELIYKNLTPVSNLPFIEKRAERAVIGQLLDHCTANAPLPNN